jgi:hypothetical protein
LDVHKIELGKLSNQVAISTFLAYCGIPKHPIVVPLSETEALEAAPTWRTDLAQYHAMSRASAKMKNGKWKMENEKATCRI